MYVNFIDTVPLRLRHICTLYRAEKYNTYMHFTVFYLKLGVLQPLAKPSISSIYILIVLFYVSLYLYYLCTNFVYWFLIHNFVSRTVAPSLFGQTDLINSVGFIFCNAILYTVVKNGNLSNLPSLSSNAYTDAAVATPSTFCCCSMFFSIKPQAIPVRTNISAHLLDRPFVASTNTAATPQDSKNVEGDTPEKYTCPNRIISIIPFRITAALELDEYPSPSHMPAPNPTMLLRPPHNSTPIGSLTSCTRNVGVLKAYNMFSALLLIV